MSTSLGNTSEYAGTSKTSSKVRPSPKNLGDGVLVAICEGMKKYKNELHRPAAAYIFPGRILITPFISSDNKIRGTWVGFMFES